MTGCACGSNRDTNLVYACSGAAITGKLIEVIAERIGTQALA